MDIYSNTASFRVVLMMFQNYIIAGRERSSLSLFILERKHTNLVLDYESTDS